jgi:hypothetical protein
LLQGRVIVNIETSGFLWMRAEPFLQGLANVAGDVGFFIGLVENSRQSLLVANGQKAMGVSPES